MLDRIKSLMFGDGAPSANDDNRDPTQLAAAALLVETAAMDGDFGAEERTVIARVLRERFSLDDAEASELIAEAEQAVNEAIEIHAFTREVKDRASLDERVRMIEMLWEVAYADGDLHDYEANLVRRAAGLLHVPDQDSGAARKRALDRLGIGKD